MMFLTQIKISKTDAIQRRLLNRYSYHKLVWTMFPGKPDSKREFLWRLNERGADSELLILSEHVPQNLTFGTQTTKPVQEKLFTFNRYRFSLVANPTKKACKDVITRQNKRVGVYSDEDLIQWLQEKGEQSGFYIESVEITTKTNESFKKKNNYCTFNSVQFDGVLNVFDMENFKAAYQAGIGSGKGFGFGMLMLAPVYEG